MVIVCEERLQEQTWASSCSNEPVKMALGGIALLQFACCWLYG